MFSTCSRFPSPSALDNKISLATTSSSSYRTDLGRPAQPNFHYTAMLLSVVRSILYSDHLWLLQPSLPAGVKNLNKNFSVSQATADKSSDLLPVLSLRSTRSGGAPGQAMLVVLTLGFLYWRVTCLFRQGCWKSFGVVSNLPKEKSAYRKGIETPQTSMTHVMCQIFCLELSWFNVTTKNPLNLIQ